MKTNKDHSLVATKTVFCLSAVLRHNMRCTGLAVLILMLSGAQLLLFVQAALAKSPLGKNGGAQQWSVQVDEVDLGNESLDSSFRAAFYADLLEELAKTKQFNEVLRSDNRNANDIPGLLILKTAVQKYTPVSEARRAASRLNVRIQLYTPGGHLVLEQVVEGDVRFIGSDLRATHNLAHNVAVTLKQSILPNPSSMASRQEAEKTPKYQVGTITAVQPHQAADADSSVASYEVSVRVGNTVYVTLYTPLYGMDTVRWAAGRELLVLVGDDIISYSDMLGNSLQVPILSRTTVTPQGSW